MKTGKIKKRVQPIKKDTAQKAVKTRERKDKIRKIKKSSMPDALDLVKKITEIADQKSAFDFYALEVKDLSSITDYFLLMSCKNERHIKAVVTEIDRKIHEEFAIRPFHVEGEYRSLWVVMDYGDVMVHVFHENTRSLYNLEELWKEGKTVPLKKR